MGYDGYVHAASSAIPSFLDEEVALLVAKYEKQIASSKLREQLTAFSTGFKSSSAAQSLNAAKDKAAAEKSLKDALNAFNEQHTAYLASKSVFDKKSPDKSKSSELKRLSALADLNMQLIRLLR